MDNLTAGNPVAHRVRVYYNGTTTIVEGMPLCYEHDSTANYWGGSVSDGEVTAATTVTETTLNPIRYINVVDPDVDNLDHFAGVVAKGGWVGKTGGKLVLDVYVPNGATVPVRANIECILGRTILSIQDGLTALGNPTTDIDDFGRDTIGTVVSRPVAIAMGTNAVLDTTAGLVLAKLCPEVFVFQGGMDDEELVVGKGNTTSVNLVVNKSLIDFKNTDGHSCAWLWRTRLSGIGSGAQKGVYRFDTMMDATTYGEYVKCVEINLEVACTDDVQTTPAHVYGLSVMMRTIMDPDMSGTNACVVNLESFLRSDAGGTELVDAPNILSWFRFNANGSMPDCLLYGTGAGIWGDTFLDREAGHIAGFAVTLANAVIQIPVQLGGVTYYLLAGTTIGTATDD